LSGHAAGGQQRNVRHHARRAGAGAQRRLRRDELAIRSPRDPGAGQPWRIVLATSGDGRLIELDAKSGTPVSSFGNGGSVVVRASLAPASNSGSYGFTSPPAIYKDLIILAPDLQEGPSHGLPGTVSAFDAITGTLAWRFYLTAQPGTPGGDSWGPGGTVNRSGPAAWDGITVDR